MSTQTHLGTLLLVACLSVGCQSDSFTGANKSKKAETNKGSKDDPNDTDQAADAPDAGDGPEGGDAVGSGQGDSGENGELSEDDEVARGQCEENVAYDPADVQCELSVNGPNVWTTTGGWNAAAAQVQDRDARWISPLAAAGNPVMCPHVPESEILIYVSHFIVKADGAYRIETLNDNNGSFRLWRNAKAEEVAFEQTTVDGAINVFSANLKKGHHSIVVDGSDYGVASAIIASIKDPSGAVVKHTQADGTWCIFRVPAGTNVAEFVRKAAACRSCLVGAE